MAKLSLNVVINNVIVDDKTIQKCGSDNIKVVIEGDVNKITVHGNVRIVDCGGSVKCRR